MPTILPISFTDLEVGYDNNLVLHGISAQIDTGSVVAITGNNGSGKSTLLKALLGITPATSGEVSLFGAQVGGPGTRRTNDVPWNKIGYVPQRVSVGGGISSTVREFVETGLLGPRQWWLPRGSRQPVEAAIERVGLAHRQSEAFRVLSGGQQQRALIARALVRDPELLLLDEPLSGLDSHNREILTKVIADGKTQGKTAVIVLHELGELAPLIDRELRINLGHLVHDGPCTHSKHDNSDPHHPPLSIPADTSNWLLEATEL